MSTKPCLAVRCQRALTRLATLALLVAAGVVAAKYVLSEKLDEQIRKRVEAELQKNYPALVVRVTSARRVEGKGIEVRGLSIAQPKSKGGQVLLQISEVLAECDTGFPDFIAKDPHFRQFQVRGLKVRAERLAGGTWNLASLLPLPKGRGESAPAVVREGTLELVDSGAGGGGVYVLRDIELSVTPQPRKSSGAAEAKPLTADCLLRIQGSLGGDHLEKIEIDGLCDPVSGHWSLRGAVEGLEFNPRMRSALPRELSSLLQPLASVRGRTHFGFHVARGPAPGRPSSPPLVQFSIDGQIAEGRIDDSRLPDPLTDVVASIHCDNRQIRIDDLSARCGSMLIQNFSAELDGYGKNSPARVRFVAKNVHLDRVPVDSLPPAAREAWARFSPQGHVHVSGGATFDGRSWHPALTVECQDLSVLYDRFQYRVNEGKGSIRLANNRLTVNLQFVGGGQKLNCTADIQNPGPNYLGWVELKSAGPLTLDERLVSALEAKSQAVVRDFLPRGGISFAGRVQRQVDRTGRVPAAVEHRQLTIQLHDLTVQHKKFPLQIDKVTGQLEFSNGDWTFRDLTGHNGSASIVGSGYWAAKAPDGNQLSLTFSATDVSLEDELRSALSPGVQDLWKNLRPRGTIDHLVVKMKFNPAAKKFGLDIDAHKHPTTQNGQVSLEPAWFQYKLEDLSGDFHYRDGVVTFQNVEAVHGKTRMTAEGTCRTAGGATSVRLNKLSADRIEVDQDLVAALPRSLGGALARLSPTGHINMDGNFGFLLPGESPAPPQLDWDLNFVMVDSTVQVGVNVEHLAGEIRFNGHSDGHILQCRGELDIASAMVHGVQVTNIKGPLLIDSEKLLAGMWAERNVRGRPPRFVTATLFGDGELSLDGQIKFTPASDFLVQASVENADLATVLADLQPSARGVTGKVFGTVNLGGTAEGVHTWRGDGQVTLKDAYLYELPTMVSVLQVLAIQRPDRNAFTESNMSFKIEGDDLEFTHLDLNGGVVSLKGKGRVTGWRELDLKFYTQIGRDEFQIFRPLVGDMNRQFLLIEVTGPLDHPTSRKTAFPKLNENLSQIFPELARERPAPPPRDLFSAPREALQRRGLLPQNK